MKKFIMALALLGGPWTGWAATLYVSLSGGHVSPYDSWANAATTIQAAVDAAAPGDAVWVTNGVYRTGSAGPLAGAPNRVAVTNRVDLWSVNGPQVTVIQGSTGSPGVRCVYVCSGAVVRGFTLTQGYAEGTDGGGAWCETGGMLSNCWVTGNAAARHGGGVFSGLVTRGVISSNTASHTGGGIYGGEFRNCEITRNQAAFGGGSGFSLGINSILRGNMTPGDGGGAYYSTLCHCTVVSNYALSWGGGVYGGLYVNCIVYRNQTSSSYPQWYGGWFTNCCTTPLPSGTGNFTDDPRLIDDTSLRLRSNSPCIDRGTNRAEVACDYDGTARPLDGNGDGANRCDVGAFEFVHATADSDHDGLSDTNEVWRIGSSPLLADSDGDGCSDVDEYITGTDPVSWTGPDELFGMDHESAMNDKVVIEWPSVTGRLYSVCSTTNLLEQWRVDAADLPGTGLWMGYTNSMQENSRCYRIKVRMAP